MASLNESRTPISAAVINFNGRGYLNATLEALSGPSGNVREILVIDSRSTDGSADWVRECYPRARLIELGENRGPGFARNVAIREAAYDRVLLLDNDVVLQEGCVEKLDAALNGWLGAVAAFPAMRYQANPSLVQFAGATPHFLGVCTLTQADVPLEDLDPSNQAMASAVTSCFLADRTRFGGQTWFDEAFFMYFEDHEFGLRATLLGHALLSVPGAQCLHDLGTVGISLRQTGEFTAIRVRHTILNRWQVLLKLYEWKTLLRFAPSLTAFEILQFAGVIRKGWLRHWAWASWELIRTAPSLWRRRKAFQDERDRRDLDVLEAGPFPFNKAMVSGRIEDLGRRTVDWIAFWNWRLLGPGD